MGYRVQDLPFFPTLPTGKEILSFSNNGAGSYQMTMAEFSYGRQAKNVTTTGTTAVAFNDFGDVLVNVNNTATIQLPAASLRLGVPVSVVDIGGFAAAHNITILPNGAETIIGQANLVISSSYGGYTLWPILTGGWYTK